MSLLTPDSGLLFWMIVSFGIVFVILSKYGFPVIVKAIEQRKAYIDNSLETARQANERLAHIQAEGEKMLAEAKEKQNAVLKEAFAEKERIIEEARKKGRLRGTSADRGGYPAYPRRKRESYSRSPLGDSGSVYRYRRESNERENRPG